MDCPHQTSYWSHHAPSGWLFDHTPSRDLCQTQLQLFLGLCQHLGIPIARENPSRAFAVIELDSVKLEAQFPRDKPQKCIDLISAFLSQKKVTLRELQMLTGLLNFTSLVVVPVRAFLWQLIDVTLGVTRPYHLIRINGEVNENLNTWLRIFSGV